MEEPVAQKKSMSPQKLVQDASPVVLSDITLQREERFASGFPELDRVLGGGIVPASLVLVGGDPGIGKSTLLLQVCQKLSAQRIMVLYISGEESLQQIKIRAQRIGQFTDSLSLLCETNLEVIDAVLRRGKPQVVVIDSIQTMYSENISSSPGSVSQVREATGAFMQLAKGLGITIFLVGHVTKEGVVAGPRVLEHMVDTVLYFEGDRHAERKAKRRVRLCRSVFDRRYAPDPARSAGVSLPQQLWHPKAHGCGNGYKPRQPADGGARKKAEPAAERM